MDVEQVFSESTKAYAFLGYVQFVRHYAQVPIHNLFHGVVVRSKGPVTEEAAYTYVLGDEVLGCAVKVESHLGGSFFTIRHIPYRYGQTAISAHRELALQVQRRGGRKRNQDHTNQEEHEKFFHFFSLVL